MSGIKRCLSHGVCLYQVMMTFHFLNDVANDAESTQQIEYYVIHVIASWKSETMDKLNRVFWYQVYQAKLLERMLNRSASLAMSTSVLNALPEKLDIKRYSPSILYLLCIKSRATGLRKLSFLAGLATILNYSVLITQRFFINNTFSLLRYHLPFHDVKRECCKPFVSLQSNDVIVLAWFLWHHYHVMEDYRLGCFTDQYTASITRSKLSTCIGV